MSNKRVSSIIIPFIGLCVAGLFLVGVGDLIKADFDTRVILQASYWQNYITNQVSCGIIYFGVSNIGIISLTTYPYTKDMEKCANYDLNSLGNQVSMNNYILMSTIASTSSKKIHVFIKRENMLEKKKAWTLKYNTKRNKEYSRKKPREKVISKYEAMLDENYINANIESLNVKYTPITYGYMLTGTHMKTDCTLRPKTPSKFSKMFKDNWRRYMISAAYMAFFTALDLGKADFDISLIYSIAIKVFNLGLNGWCGRQYSSTFVREQILYEIHDRIDLWFRYNRMLNEKEVTPLCQTNS